MPAGVPDDALAEFLQRKGMLSAAQIAVAREFQTQLEGSGERISLADALVGLCFLTPAQREEAERQVQARGQGEIHQLLHYRLLRKIGEGTMGVVYLAEDVDVPRLVALKVLGRRFARNEKFIRRFEREADATARLSHENIVGAFAFGEDQGRHFYVMEYCAGETLDRRLKREGRLPLEEATRIVIQVARGLQYAHERGFIHRDIKPGNIIMSGNVAKILDLGLTKNIAGEEDSFRTQTGLMMGTPHYISPEQAIGKSDLDGRTDIYSLGATYFQFVTGQHPFQGASSIEVISKHVHDRPPDPRDLRPEIPEGMARVILRMMAKKREHRHRDCGELLRDLESLAQGKEPARGKEAGDGAVAGLLERPSTRRVPKTSVSPTTRRAAAAPASRLRLRLAAGSALAAVLLLALLVAIRPGRKTAPPRAAPPPPPSPASASPSPAAPPRPPDRAPNPAPARPSPKPAPATTPPPRSPTRPAPAKTEGPRRMPARMSGPYQLDAAGHIQNWLIAGPFPNPGDRNFYVDFLNTEEEHQPCEGLEVATEDGRVRWEPLFTPNGLVDFFKVPHLRLSKGHRDVIEYAACRLECDRDMEVEIRLGSDDGFRLWVDGVLRLGAHQHRKVTEDDDACAVRLSRGFHLLLVKVDQGDGDHGLLVRVVTPEGNPPSGVRVWN